MSSIIFGRKQIIIAALIVALGVAIYLNYTFAGKGLQASKTSSDVLGETQYVITQNVSGASGTSTSDYFASAQLTRKQAQDKAIAAIKEIAENASATKEAQAAAATSLAELAKTIKSEADIENAIKAKGFKNVVASIGDKSVTIIVQPKSGTQLSSAEIAQISDIVIKATDVTSDQINIYPPK